MRILALDVGRRRTGVALSDPNAILATPLTTLVGTDVLEDVLALVHRMAVEDDGVASIVVGVPTRLDGTPSQHAAFVRDFIDRLRARVDVPVHPQDERLTSQEAETRLGVRERDWRKRKAKLDAAAAAVILQEFLDRRSEPKPAPAPIEASDEP